MTKKRIIIILITAAAIAGAYLNRAYAYIYSRFDTLKHPEAIAMTVEKKDHNIKYAALGDSLTFGVGADNTTQSWPSVLAGKMSNNQTSVELVNLSAPGAASQDVIDSQLDKAISAQPDLITLLIGVNDMHNFVPLKRYSANLEYILNELKNKTKARIYLINLPYLGAADTVLPPYNFYFDLETNEFNRAIKEAAQKSGLEPIDIHAAKNYFEADQSLYSADGFHPSAGGYELWAKIIYDSIQ